METETNATLAEKHKAEVEYNNDRLKSLAQAEWIARGQKYQCVQPHKFNAEHF